MPLRAESRRHIFLEWKWEPRLARGLTREQSAMLAAVLPNPTGWDPAKPGRTLRWRQRRILQRERNANFPEELLR
ncbi:MAG TPA: hypothetical protein VNP98_01975 [Chthoniobacterales bacterium]|nr:hypothetical protein [Chthoniobacterales bacterium]